MKFYDAVVGVALVALLILGFNLNNTYNQIERVNDELLDLRYQISALEADIEEIKAQNRLVSKTDYTIDTWKPMPRVSVSLLLNTSDSTTEAEIQYRVAGSQDSWESTPVSVVGNSGSLVLTLSSEHDYELQFVKKGQPEDQYEALPMLEIHKKLESAFGRAIHLNSFKDGTLKFDVQVAQLAMEEELTLSSATCEIYHKGELVMTYDIVKLYNQGNQNSPKRIIEHGDHPFWYINESYTFDKTLNTNIEDITVKLSLVDSHGNHYFTEAGF